MKTKIIALLLIILFAAVVFSYNLSHWPMIWYDEGLHLQAAKNLAISGRYGINSTEGFRVFDPLITTGPTVLVPIALIFKLFGIHLLWARAVIVLYALLVVFAYFLVAEKLFNLNTAIVASLLLITLSASLDDISGSFLALSRMVMGEVPALFWMLIGSYFWFRHLSKEGYVALTVAGFCFGLAVVTKPQYLLVIVTFLMIYVVDRIWYRQLRIRQVIIPIAISIAITAVWYAYQSSQSATNYIGQAAILDRIGGQISLFNFSLIVRSTRVLLASGVLVWGVPGLIYGLFKSKERDILGIQRGFFIIFCLLWFFWYIFGSISWIRYAFPSIAIMILYMALLLVDLTENFVFTKWRPRPGVGVPVGELRIVKSLAVTVAVIMMVIVPLEVRLKDVFTASDNSPEAIASYLQQNVPSGIVVETMEPEIAFLSDRNFHQPTLDIQNGAVRFVQLGQPYPPDFYPRDSINANYLVLGPYGKWTQLYEGWLEEGHFTPVISIGGYDLYKLNGDSSP